MENSLARVKRTANVTVKLPALSPPFISADDAARFAHEAIGNKRDREYGGAILRHEDGRFFATLPIAGDTVLFDHQTMMSTDAQGNFVHPAGFKCYAFYHSHPAHTAKVKEANPSFSDDFIAVVMSFYSEADKYFIIHHRAFAPAHYLSGAENCLLKYVSSGSAAEDQVAKTIREGRAPDSFANFEGPIHELAQAGTLGVVVPNTVWGGRRGQIHPQWTLNTPVTTSRTPTEQPFCTRVFDQSAKAVDAVLGFDGTPSDDGCMGFILKAVGKDEYVATQPLSALTPLFSPIELFPQRANGGPKLPSNFRLDGIYYRSRPVAAQRPPRQAWLYDNFFSPQELAAAIAQSRTDTYLLDSQRGLTLHMRAKGNALLSYQCSGSAAETALLSAQGTTLHNELKAGTLSAFDFVLKVAAAGRLTVVETGDVWDKTGVVEQNWRPFERIHQALGPAFLSADDAARHVHEQLGDVRTHDCLGYVLERSDGKFFATQPVRSEQWLEGWGLPHAGGVSSKLIELPGYRYKGQYLANAQTQARVKELNPSWSEDEINLYVSMPSIGAIAGIASQTAVPALYHSGAGGSLIKYVCSRSQEELNFKNLLAAALAGDHTIGKQLDGYDGSTEQLVKKLVRTGELSVIVSNRAWRGSRGKVPTAWVAYEPFDSASPVAPALSWVFQDAETAAQFAHDQMLAKPTVRQVAFILKNSQVEEYVVTDPAVIDAANSALPLFSPLHAFAVDDAGKFKLPEGYALQSICYLSLPDASSAREEKWVYECFVSPTDFALAVGTSRVGKPTGFALYISTRDRAQLKYVFSQSAQENQLYAVNPHGIVTDNGDQADLLSGTLTPSAFVKRVAAAGEMSVIQTGRLWDVAGSVDQNWQPFALHPKPVLSPSFLTADDAARYAHERIGNQRDYEFSGYILQRQDQRFVVTEPLDNFKFGRFTPGAIYPVDASGKAILPERHVLYGVYASCLALSMYDPDKMQRYSWTRQQACIDAQMFTDVDIHTIVQNRHSVSLAYLSTAEDSLIAYDCSGSTTESALLKQVAPGPQGSLLAQDLASGALVPEDVVKQLADAGGLRVVVESDLWGAPGMVPEYWKAFPSAKDRAVPEQVAFGAIFASMDAAAKDAHQRVRRHGPDQTCFGFILKHKSKEEYIVSETVTASDKQALFSLASLFRTHETGGFEYPQDFDLNGLFHARQWMPKGLGSTEAWLAQHFISSSDLYKAFFEARRRKPKDATAGLQVYISTLDKALLKYQTPDSTTLFDARIQPSGAAEDVHTQLASGQLLPKDFVTRVATLSWLTVVVPNEFWGEQGTARLTEDWEPYPQNIRRALSPAFICEADAVRYAYRLLGNRRDKIYGGLILRSIDGLFVATEPMEVPTENFDPVWILPDEHFSKGLRAPGCSIVGRYRSRALTEYPFQLTGLEKGVYRNLLSTEVLSTALASSQLWNHEYLFGPDGSLISFTLLDEDRDLLTTSLKNELTARVTLLENQLAPSTDSPHDPWSNLIERRIRNGAATPTEFVTQLVKAAAVHVLESSNLWGPVQKLHAGWQPLTSGYSSPETARFALVDRTLSPTFEHMDDAVHYAHERAGRREHMSYGLILKSSRRGHFVTSLPVVADELKFAFDRVFPNGVLPTGYTVQGLYVCAPARQPDELPSHDVYYSFVPPSVLATALAAVGIPGQALRFQPLYLSCADGALLKYEAVRLDSDLQFGSGLRAYVKTLQEDGDPAQYIRKVIAAGYLSVLVSSPVWASTGRAIFNWQPRQISSYVSNNERLPLGPLCLHPDDAARQVWRLRRVYHGKAYLGAILRNEATHTFVAVQPLNDTGSSVVLGEAYRRLFSGVMNTSLPASNKYPTGYEVMGVQQIYKLDDTPHNFSTHYEKALYRNFIAHGEIRAVIDKLRVDNVPDARYYLTPRNGALLAYAPGYSTNESEVLFNDWQDVENGVTRSKLQEVLGTLAKRGRFYVLEPDKFWQPRGQLATKEIRELSRRGDSNPS
ncbi:hypothetical protein PMI35_03783 [Pseudomonas sp. GM78]|uniref:DUF4329 domain-containing protein n=1 Tax=Pseudomonas sp. GM78 TaxID=1144337 RepID=UPI000270C156|nr:DUF4329 domain-containing protein [Pseudomonas sp. GM78]EJN26719.1 hypothetical protein PMI35_03783 [Pseudomonas sp. GM78]